MAKSLEKTLSPQPDGEDREERLREYRRKRAPEQTPEPFGGPTLPSRAAAAPHLFVIQQHAARRMHWDFRLEIDGVLASWAVPRGPSIDAKEKRLAVRTEDHPLDYANFEGIIPAGNYGAGAVIVWDRGAYRCVDGFGGRTAIERGKIDMELQGHKLRGRWALVKTKGGAKGNEWLLIRKTDGPAHGPEPVGAQPQSVLSGLTVEEVAARVSRSAELAAAAEAAGAQRRTLAGDALLPMLAEPIDKPFSAPGWIFELKYDGVRALATRAEGTVRLLSRRQRDIAATFPEVALALGHLPCESFVLDGEIVALDERGAASFERLQRRLGQGHPAAVARASIEVPVVMYCFDLLAAAGYDLRPLPLRIRKRLLARLVPRLGIVRFCDHIERGGEELFAAASELSLEGVVAKDLESPYQSGRRSPHWRKIKTERVADFAVVGYVPGKGTRKELGSLMLAWRRDGQWVYAGNVGSGLDAATVRALRPRLDASRRPRPIFVNDVPEVTRHGVFVEPLEVAEVRYAGITAQGVLRHPVFLRLRDDKAPEQCSAPLGLGAVAAQPPPPRTEAPHRVPLSNLNKVFWPEEGYTKGDLLRYYESIWPKLAPYLRDRPLVLTRYPDGISGKSFFQHNAPEFTPDWIATHHVEDTDYFICNDLDTLLYIVNLGCIPLHVWSARTLSLDRPDWAVLDLDPKGAPFSHVVKIARHVHSVLEPLGAPHYVKTSGQDGLHVLIPLGASLSHAEAKTFAEVLARVVVAGCGPLATIARPLSERGGKVYVDFGQNGFGKTIAAPFSVRPRSGAPVSTPLAWNEVGARFDPRRFTIKTVPRRFARRPDPLRGVLTERADIAQILHGLQHRLASHR